VKIRYYVDVFLEDLQEAAEALAEKKLAGRK
jgi:hypothetical protein